MFIISKIMRKVIHVMSAGFSTVILWCLAFNIVFGVLFYFVERDAQDGLTLADSIWWAMVTMTTVGYGDFYAQTFVGRFFISYPCMILGIGLIGYLVGLAANLMIDIASKKRKGLMTISHEGHIIICNYPNLDKVMTLLDQLRANQRYAKAKFVLVTETLEELPDPLRKMGMDFVRGYPTVEETLHRANVGKCAGVIVLAQDPNDIASDDRSYTVGSVIELIEKEIERPIKTIVELVGRQNVRNMTKADVDGYIVGEGINGCLLVQEFDSPGVAGVIAQLLSNVEGSQIYLHSTTLVGKTLKDLQLGLLQSDSNVQLLGFLRDRQPFLNPDKQTVLAQGDQLILLSDEPIDFATTEAQLFQPAPV